MFNPHWIRIIPIAENYAPWKRRRLVHQDSEPIRTMKSMNPAPNDKNNKNTETSTQRFGHWPILTRYQIWFLFSRSAAVLGSRNVSTPSALGLEPVSPASNAAAPEDGRTPLSWFRISIRLLAMACTAVLLLSSEAFAATFRFASSSNRIYVESGGSATLSDIKAALPNA